MKEFTLSEIEVKGRERVVVKIRFCLTGIADYAANVYYSCWRVLNRLIY